MTNSEYTYYGMNNTYNAKMAYHFYSSFAPTPVNPSHRNHDYYMGEMATQYGLSVQNLYNIFETLGYMI